MLDEKINKEVNSAASSKKRSVQTRVKNILVGSDYSQQE